MKKKFIAYGLLLVSCLCLLVVGIVTVLATTQRGVDAGLFVRFTAEDVDGSVTMYYRIGGSGDWIKNGETIVFNAEDNENQARTTDLTLDSEVTKSSKYVEFKYEFVNTGSKYYTATMMLETTERENISLTYKYNDPTETKEYDDFKYAVVVPGETDASNAKTYFIKVGMEDLSRSANFSGTFNWILKGYNLVNNEEIVLTNLDYVETSTAGTYSAKYNGSPLDNNTLVIPSKLGDSPVTTVGKCEGILPANTKVIVSEGIARVSANAFNGQTGLAEIELPASLEVIDTSAFVSCENLTTITFAENSKLKEIKASAFRASGLNGIELPNNLESIGSLSFFNTQIKSITIPASVSVIESSALGAGGGMLSEIKLESDEYFVMVNQCLIEKSTGRLIVGLDGCVSIPTIETGSPVTVKIIETYSLMGVDTLTNGNIPEGVKEIQDSAMRYCNGLTNVSMPSTLLKIGSNSIGGDNIKSILISSSVTEISQSAFRYCSNLSSIEIVGGNNEYFKMDGNCLIDVKNKILLTGFSDSEIPTDGSVLLIGRGAFQYREQLKSISIPSTITYIGDGAFYQTGLIEIIIPSSVALIEQNVFGNCQSLTKISLSGGNWQISTDNKTYSDIPSTYDLTDSSIVANLFKTTYKNYYWKRV